MAETTNTTVTLQINGKQAEETLTNLRKRVLDLSNEIAKAASQGDKITLKKLRKELTETKRQIKEIESATMQVESVMKRLDKASPRELQKTLATLNKQLEFIERGTPAWDAHVAKIKRVKDEVAKMNAELSRSQTWVQKFNQKFSELQTIGAGIIGAVTGLTLAGRKAVSNYAEMDEQLANTRKYTGMTVEQVEELNEAFKQMNTRTARTELNELAQEAGRLGKTSQEDVLGYVQAADIINVALEDLGEGATQVIAKLTNIFGVDAEMGTRDAMLSVGSAVNVLSQNCTADKKYLVEFAQRMAGIGSVAQMSIPEILAFGATLDANGQKCEMSASSLGKLIMQLYQKPAEMAKKVGLDVDEFQKTMKRSTNEGVLMFLQRIKELGAEDGLAVLAPMFKELGVDGVRMSQIMATLADKLDMVRWEQDEATKAFSEATSATNEYNIFNNTAQAGIDKARKRFSELTIELGEKLLPVMSHVLTTSSMTMRALNVLVDFIIKYRKELFTVVSAIVAYNVAVNAAIIKEKLHSALIAVKTAALHVHRVAVLAASVAYNKLTGNTTRANAAMKLLNQTMKLNPWGLLAAAITAAVTALVLWIKSSNEQTAAEKSLNEIRKQSAKQVSEEKQKIDLLVKAAQNEKLSLDERKKACQKLNEIIPKYNAHLDETTGKYIANKEALDDYLKSLARQYEVEGAKTKLQELGGQKADLSLQQKQAQADIEAARKRSAASATMQQNTIYTTGGGGGVPVMTGDIVAAGQTAKAEAKLKSINKQLKEIQSTEQAIFDIYGSEIEKMEVDTPIVTNSNTTNGNATSIVNGDTDTKKGKSDDKNKFQEDDDWREMELAKNRIAYATGEKDYREYTETMHEIEVEYYEKNLKHADLSEKERLQIEASYYEAIKKERQNCDNGTIEAENNTYAELQRINTERYIRGELTSRQYQNTLELLELEHLQKIVEIYEEGSEERLKAERAYQTKSQQNQLKHAQEAQKLQEQFKKQYFAKAYQLPDQDGYDYALQNLELVHQQMLTAAGDNNSARLKVERAFQEARYQLSREYNVKLADDEVNAFRAAIDQSIEWLNSDAGQAMTQSFSTIVNQMSAIFSGMSDLIKAELDIQTASIENKYEAEISMAEGNKYKEVQLNKQKEKELAEAKKESNRKLFAMQVIQAVAQTAISALNAYSSAAAIPVVGFVMAPIAAAMAVAAGAIQIAALKKQQQASEAQGYAEGGFTPKGGKYEPVGIVHAGEWVASQELVNNPNTRPLIDALDQAQRTNRIGSLQSEDVSRSITAPIVIAGATTDGKIETAMLTTANTLNNYTQTMRQLSDRLNEPFVTVNTVTGDSGIKQAQDEYEQLIKNKTPKSRR